jgi:general nucleoside transport system permease protein
MNAWTWLGRLRTLWACLLGLALGAVLIALSGASPWKAYSALLHSAFLDYWGFAATLVKASPILLAALAVAVPLRAGLFNIGAEGQIYAGALLATIVALRLPPLPEPVGMVVVMLAAMAGGALWAAVPGYLRAYHGVNEVIVTLLLNFVAIQMVSYAVSGPLLAQGAPYPYSEEVDEALRLPILVPQSDAHIGVLLGIGLALMLHFFFQRSSAGHALDIVGRNSVAAQYAGIAVQRQLFGAMAGGGALAGLAGGLEVLGLKYRLFHLFSPGYGFDGIVVAFMAGANMAWLPVAAILMSGLKAAANAMQRVAGIEGTVVDAIQGLIVICVAASQRFTWQQMRRLLRFPSNDSLGEARSGSRGAAAAMAPTPSVVTKQEVA